MVRRSKLEIYRDILESLSGEHKVTTRISDDTHLNYKRCRENIEKMENEALLVEADGEYYLTGKGEKTLQIFRELKEMMGELIHKPEPAQTNHEEDPNTDD